MPELPEIETIKRYLTPQITGKVIISAKTFPGSTFEFSQDLNGYTIEKLSRHGKVLTLHLSQVTARNEMTKQSLHDLYLQIHLKMSGQLLYAKDKKNAIFDEIVPMAASRKLPARTTRAVIEFSDNSALFFNDLRKFGWVKITENLHRYKGIDVLGAEFTLENFKKALENTSRAVKTVIMDQHRIAGVGNIYANDALWKAKIHPAKPASILNSNEISNLYSAVKTTIEEGIGNAGSSAKDDIYILPDGSKGNYQNHFKVYDRENTDCFECGNIIIKTQLGGRGTFYCPTCQPTHSE